MIQIEFRYKKKGKKIKAEKMVLPSSWNEITLRQFIEWNLIVAKEELGSFQKTIEIVAALSGRPKEFIEDLPPTAFNELAEKVLPIMKDGIPEPSPEEMPRGIQKWKVAGEWYFFEPDYFRGRIGDVAGMHQLLKDKDLMNHFHYVLACCCHKKGEAFNIDTVTAKAKLFLDGLTMGQIYASLFFSSNGSAAFKNFIANSSMAKQATTQEAIKRIVHLSIRGGVGTATA